MDKSIFKKLFGKEACNNGFEFSFGGWFKESNECVIAIDLQKSNYGKYYYVNIKVFIQGTFGKTYVKSKALVKNEIGNIFTRTPPEYDDVLDIESTLEFEERKEKLHKLFSDFIVPETNKTITRAGIKSLAESGEFLLPAIKKELGL